MMIKLLSYNILFGNRLTAITDWLNQTETQNGGFDILCFQEFPCDQIGRFLNQRRQNSSLSRFTPCFQRRKKHFGQLTVFAKDKFRLTRVIGLSLGKSRLENRVFKLFRGEADRRSLLTFLETKNRQKLLIANTHLTCIGSNGHRIVQLSKIMREIDGAPTALVLGDFNYSSFLPRYKLRRLMKKHRLEDATTKLKTHRLFFLKHQLDYIFTKGVTVQKIGTEKVGFSDHYPITAHFKLS